MITPDLWLGLIFMLFFILGAFSCLLLLTVVDALPGHRNRETQKKNKMLKHELLKETGDDSK